MRVSIALLADDAFQQTFQERQDAICQDYGFTPDNHDFWPHVSLKMPFVTADVDSVRSYFQEFADTVPPLTLNLTEMELWSVPAQNDETGVLFLNVAEKDTLHILHNRLNHELMERFQNTQAPFDGDDFHFHLTLATGGASKETYQHIWEREQQNWPRCRCSIKAISLAFQDETAPEKGWQRGWTHSY